MVEIGGSFGSSIGLTLSNSSSNANSSIDQHRGEVYEFNLLSPLTLCPPRKESFS